MNIDKIKTLIDNKIKEHESIASKIIEDLNKLKEKDLEIIKSKDLTAKANIIQKIILKDKIIFHKAAIETLQDLKKELIDERQG